MGLPDVDIVRPELVAAAHRCMICHEVLLEPMECPCETAFCGACIKDWLQEKPECPSCRARLTEATLKNAHRTLRSCLDGMEVRCLEPACGWTGALEARASHECLPHKIKEMTTQIAKLQEELRAEKERVEDLTTQLQNSQQERQEETEKMTAAADMVQKLHELFHSGRGASTSSAAHTGKAKSTPQAKGKATPQAKATPPAHQTSTSRSYGQAYTSRMHGQPPVLQDLWDHWLQQQDS
mmetsp:Transcript_6616/g.14408  ORF Transcript_6616/g.14408 Transcript_6616/m.14408 type:complete len:239 (+) Transcript_6616:110-826(+)